MIVTVSNEYGSGALAVAERVARVLGYEYVDRQLPVVVAKRLRVAPETVEASEDTEPSLGERLLNSLELATPELAESTAEAFDEELIRAVEEAVREYAAHGDAVIVGRGAGAILGVRPDVVRVFMHAPREWRIARVVEAMRTDRKNAEVEVDRVDRARTAYIRERYGLTFGDPGNYDLCLDTSRFSASAAGDAIVAAVRARGG
ncbi:MAG: cytidylate kinase-like family protein [Candidatus Baltobacteraceae bacterium]